MAKIAPTLMCTTQSWACGLGFGLSRVRYKNRASKVVPSDHCSPFTGIYTSGGLLVISEAAGRSDTDSSRLGVAT